MSVCVDPKCDGNIPGDPRFMPGGHSHLSMPDPCPHVSRIDIIAARFSGDGPLLDEIERHLAGCKSDKQGA